MSELRAKTMEWVQTQGYPLEYATAAAFEAAGFEVQQSVYVASGSGEVAREVDVIASITEVHDGRTYSVSFVVECKWSKHKPWVVFTGQESAREELLAYAVGTFIGEGVVWELIEDPVLYDLRFFEPRRRTGYAGRQALTEKNDRSDLFYTTLQGLAAAAVGYARSEDEARMFLQQEAGVNIIFPLLVIEGDLFEASFDGAELQLVEAPYSRVRWRGFRERRTPIFVDIVSSSDLSRYVRTLKGNTAALINRLPPAAERVVRARGTHDWAMLTVKREKYPNLLIPEYLRSAGYR